MCSLQEHIERDIRARENERQAQQELVDSSQSAGKE